MGNAIFFSASFHSERFAEYFVVKETQFSLNLVHFRAEKCTELFMGVQSIAMACHKLFVDCQQS